MELSKLILSNATHGGGQSVGADLLLKVGPTSGASINETAFCNEPEQLIQSSETFAYEEHKAIKSIDPTMLETAEERLQFVDGILASKDDTQLEVLGAMLEAEPEMKVRVAATDTLLEMAEQGVTDPQNIVRLMHENSIYLSDLQQQRLKGIVGP